MWDMSANSLLHLVDHFQRVESAVVDLLFLSAVKLQSLVDAEVFLLVAGKDRRRFYATPRLAASFLDGAVDAGLQVEEGDVRVEPVAEGGESTNAWIETTITSPPQNRKRTTAPTPDSSSLGAKRRRSSIPDWIAEPASIAVDDGADVKEEIEEIIVEDDDDDHSRIDVAAARVTPFSTEGTLEDAGAPFDVNEDPRERQKIAALMGVEDPWEAFRKGTVENRLLTSVFYNFGKNLALRCPAHEVTFSDPSVSAYFARHVNDFLRQFPRLLVDREAKPPSLLESPADDVLRHKTASSFIKKAARNGFEKGVVFLCKTRDKT